MKRIERHPRKNCENCGIRFVFGAHLEDWDERLKELGLTKVYGLYPSIDHPDLRLKIEDCDGIFMSDLIDDDLKCPICGASALQDIEVEYAEHCIQCGCTREVRQPRSYIGSGQPDDWFTKWVCKDCPEEPENEPDPKGDLLRAVNQGDVLEVERLLDAGVGVDDVNIPYNYQPPLGWASSDPRGLAVARLLLTRGANVNAHPNGGWTALMNAAYSNCPETVALLLEHGAGISIRNEHGQTALDLALLEQERTQEGHDQVIALLNAASSPNLF